jgi:hypothetical protein
MRPRLAVQLAWAAYALAVAIVGAAVVLAVVNVAAGSARPAEFGLAYALIALTYGLVGVVVVGRRPDSRVGWLFCVIGLPSGLSCLGDQYGRLALVTRPGSLPGGAWAAWIGAWAWIITPLAFPLLLLVFPDGRLPSPRWRPALWLCAAVLVVFGALVALAPRRVIGDAVPKGLVISLPADNPLVGDALGPFLRRWTAGLLALGIGGILVGLSALLVRFRRSRGVERQQLKWFLFGGAVSVLGAFTPSAWFNALTGPSVAVGAGVAILRYRLYDIDRLVNRTLVYATVTAILGLAYTTVVLALGQLAGQDQSSLAVAAATLAAAALFRPVRRRVQEAVDRRFNRRRYDARRTVEQFSRRLREEVDLDTLTGQLLAVVAQTMEPTTVSLWLKTPSRDGHRPGAPWSHRATGTDRQEAEG